MPETAAPIGLARVSATAPVPTVFPLASVTVAPAALSDETWNDATAVDVHDAVSWFVTARLPVLTVEERLGGERLAATVSVPEAKFRGDAEASSVVRAGNSGGSPGSVVAM